MNFTYFINNGKIEQQHEGVTSYENNNHLFPHLRSIYFLLALFVGIVDEVALMQPSMHEEVLCSVVGDHDDGSSEVCPYRVELQKTQQVVGNREQGSPDQDEVKRRIFGLFIS